MAVDPARAKSLFLAASDLADPAEQVAFLDRECGDTDLRARVEALLRANATAPPPEPELAGTTGTFDPDAPPAAPTADFPGKDERVGAVLAGKYKLVEEIGEGGMGSVYMAQQTEPVKRAVAVKVIKAGMDSKAVLARFEAERQALAMMDHPNIAKVLDAGTTENGRPYFVMELVKGVPITEYCDAHKLTPRRRLELFVPVCLAIQHAHQKGVIHRDIKPSNVIVAMYDDKPVPKVIDFGVAKAAGPALTDKTLMTGFGAVVGTPEYMSPEQANLNNLDIDTRSDVYSLGVLLYELLTGTTPVDRKCLGKAALLEVLRIVREVEAPKPSAKLSSSTTLPSVAANRGTEPAKLSKLMKGELDWVLLKALEKDRARRYETANSLVRDLQRYLADEVVEARPPSAGYRLKKFVRRHKGQVIAAGLVLFALLAGVIGTTWGLIRAERANAGLAAKNAELDAERDKVQARFDTAVKAIETFHTGVSEDALLKNAEFKELRTKLLKEAARFYEDLEKQLAGQTDPKSRKTLAAGYFQLAELTDKIGDQKQALELYRKALVIRRELATEPGADVETRLDVALSLCATGTLLLNTGDPTAALAAFQEQHDLAAALEAESPTDAVRVIRAYGYNGIGFVLDDTGKKAEALDAYRKALALYRKLPESGQFHDPGQGFKFGLQLQTGTLSSIGVVLATTGKLAEGLGSFRKASEIMERLAEAHPANTSVQAYLANSYGNIAAALIESGKPAEALEALRKALAVRQKLVDASPAVTDYQARLAWHHRVIGIALLNTGKPAEAQTANRKAFEISQKLVKDNPAVTAFQDDLANDHNIIGVALVSTGKPVEALEAYCQALAIIQKLANADPGNASWKGERAWFTNNIGRALDRQKRWSEAITALDEGLTAHQKLAEADPNNPGYGRALGWSHAFRGGVRFRNGQPADSAADLRRALELWAKLPSLDIETQVERSRALALLAGLGGDAKSGVTPAEAQTFADQSIAALADVIKAGWALPSELKEPDFDALRGRADFQKLVAEGEAKAETVPEIAPPSHEKK
jgi:serine/threonine protein kinase/tetratricopeptide (TPR) repeat protein